MKKPCRICRQLIEASEYDAHRLAHANLAKPNRQTPEWRKARLVALRRDRWTCQKCGRNKQELGSLGILLHVHHINEDPRDNRLENLVSLCEDDHNRGGLPQRYRT